MTALHQVVDHPLQHHLYKANRRKEKSHIQAVMWKRNKVKNINIKENVIIKALNIKNMKKVRNGSKETQETQVTQVM